MASNELLDLLNKGIAREMQVSIQYMWQHVLWKGIEGFVVKDDLFIAIDNKGIGVLKGDEAVLLPHLETFFGDWTNNSIILPFGEDKMLIATNKGRFFVYDLEMLYDTETRIHNYRKKGVPPSILREFSTSLSVGGC